MDSIVGKTAGYLHTMGGDLLPSPVKQGAQQLSALGYYEYCYAGRDNRGNVVWKLTLGDGKVLMVVTRLNGWITKG